MSIILKIWIAYLLDLILGDPYWFPHPVRFIGKYITFIENKIYSLKNKKVWGGVLAFTVILSTVVLSYYIARTSEFLEIFFLYTTLATKSLGAEGIKVYKILKSGDLQKAQKELSYLVSRDTGEMDEIQVVRSTMETIAENSVDGIIAPMFYAFLGSFIVIDGVSMALPLAMGYKAVNTLDSMVGYKNDKYIDFGMVSAKVDDFFNFIPARLSGLIIIPIATFLLGMGIKKPLKIFFRDRKNHSSPNSGHPEAVFAGAIGVQFGGKTKYFGKYFEKPTIGDKLKEFQCEDIKKCYKIMFMTSFVGIVLFTTFIKLV
ncbi:MULTISPECIES: adenosylcobinamide-phosphate synthase CbiB [Cetobacterium]|uniref:adenosylcobinamide-phosphate synthase CbiB n=1 Tax=Cetobacterium TaxID=180162 RepID=UPI00163C4EDE|nr:MULTISPECIES: adenosylcobinamide-phosphate synthase CbiB [Cetobacterium]MBC2854801.1 cobalamin biosynthesis protein CobD [Cetobacterium sp. 2G large]MCQ9627670.1 cobalamin biosynthesis protein CobD [Cetobacterium somerae]